MKALRERLEHHRLEKRKIAAQAMRELVLPLDAIPMDNAMVRLQCDDSGRAELPSQSRSPPCAANRRGRAGSDAMAGGRADLHPQNATTTLKPNNRFLRIGAVRLPDSRNGRWPARLRHPAPPPCPAVTAFGHPDLDTGGDPKGASQSARKISGTLSRSQFPRSPKKKSSPCSGRNRLRHQSRTIRPLRDLEHRSRTASLPSSGHVVHRIRK